MSPPCQPVVLAYYHGGLEAPGNLLIGANNFTIPQQGAGFSSKPVDEVDLIVLAYMWIGSQ
jgi:hypothetical protein